MPVDAKQWLSDLLKDGGIEDDAARKVVEQLATNEKIAKRVQNDVGLQSEFNRKMNEISEQEKGVKGYWEQLDQWAKDKAAEYQQLQTSATKAGARAAALEAYVRQIGGDPNDASVGEKPATTTIQQDQSGQWVTKEQYRKDFETHAVNAGATMKDVGYLTGHHYKRFNEPLDWDALEKFAVDGKHTNLRAAYAAWIDPRAKEIDQQQRKTEIEAARAEGYAAAAAKAGMPTDTAGPGPTPSMFFTRPADPALPPNATEWERDQFFAQEFGRDAAAGAKPI